jgi:hypothetical protein
MKANPESRTQPTSSGRSWWCGLALNYPDVFSVSIHPLDPGDHHMLSQKLFVDVGVDLLA